MTVLPTRYGRVLMTGDKFALYSFARDGQGGSTCNDACARRWPPLITHGRPVARGALRSGALGSVRRRDGALQVTYAGHPLYRYVGDTKPREILCQNVDEFGGRWTVVSARGAPVR